MGPSRLGRIGNVAEAGRLRLRVDGAKGGNADRGNLMLLLLLPEEVDYAA